jgi:hypothetical protein
MGFSPKFRNTIKTFYTNAEAVVMINGEISKPSIESDKEILSPASRLTWPLACLIRNSDHPKIHWNTYGIFYHYGVQHQLNLTITRQFSYLLDHLLIEQK